MMMARSENVNQTNKLLVHIYSIAMPGRLFPPVPSLLLILLASTLLVLHFSYFQLRSALKIPPSRSLDAVQNNPMTHELPVNQLEMIPVENFLRDDSLTQGNRTVETDNLSRTPWEVALEGREPLLEILREAGVTDIDLSTLQSLPKWETVIKLYGSEPVIHGLDRCEEFRNNTPPEKRSMGPAGLFNTGTNALTKYLEMNCVIPEVKRKDGGMRWQPHWGKHSLATMKHMYTANNFDKDDKDNMLPVVLVRDPLTWLTSMCTNPYSAKWTHHKSHCPALVPNADDIKQYPDLKGKASIPGKVRFGRTDDNNTFTEQWPSMAYLWSFWNIAYYEKAEFPSVMVRFEDLIFHPRKLVETVCACGGGIPRNETFQYYRSSAKEGGKGHGKEETKTSMVSAMIKYGSESRRVQNYTRDDLEHARHALNRDLMNKFHYSVPAFTEAHQDNERVDSKLQNLTSKIH
jgi:hypothetical protein